MTGTSAPVSSIRPPSTAPLTSVVEELEEEQALPGFADLQAAIGMVASGAATSVTICGVADSHRLLRIGQELAVEGLALEPVIRRGGGGFDLRVRQIL